jgi:hypothetical protein
MEKTRLRIAETFYLDHLDEKPVQAWIEELSKYASQLDTEISFNCSDYGDREIFINIYRDETDEEMTTRIQKEEDWKKSSKERRYDTYLKLKEEFEITNNPEEVDPLDIDIVGDLG